MVVDGMNLKLLEALGNQKVIELVNEYVALCKPAKVTILTDSQEHAEYVRNLALRNKEEHALRTRGHTIHWDGINDQGRDTRNTRILMPKGKRMSNGINTVEREEGLAEVRGMLDGIMAGREMLVSFYCLGPAKSRFSQLAMQITDSAYVTHSEMMLYRPGYEEFKQLAHKNAQEKNNFFFFVHSSGELDERGNTKHTDKRRIYIDLQENCVFTVNNQYAGNAVGLKKLALRLAINKANHEDWLCEHMFIAGVHSNGGKQRTTYFTGAYPSACGKTSTAMIPGQTIVGDDIAYIRLNGQGVPHAVNVEQGIFGIIADVNPIDDPVIYKALTTPRELIFSNILVKDGMPYWLNMGEELPESGENFAGKWHKGMTSADGKEILPAHKNARYTIRLKELENVDAKLDDPEGVPVSGILYGVRDANTNVPIAQALSWQHGVMLGASIETEKTAAAIGREGEIAHDPMSNMDFLVVPLGLYLKNHLSFGARCKRQPLIFTTNYFLKKDGKFLNDKVDKKVWLIWAEGRVHGEYDAVTTPVGNIPRYEDLKMLFAQVFKKEYAEEMYVAQFSIRARQLLEKFERIEKIFEQEPEIPSDFWRELREQKERLERAIEQHGDIISPFAFDSAAAVVIARAR
jgi:phosphoenolpyruvate carboxykinase (GTP)